MLDALGYDRLRPGKFNLIILAYFNLLSAYNDAIPKSKIPGLE